MPENERASPLIEANKAYSREQICDVLGITSRTLARWRRDDGFPVRDAGKGGIVLGSDVLEWMRKRPLRNGGTAT